MKTETFKSTHPSGWNYSYIADSFLWLLVLQPIQKYDCNEPTDETTTSPLRKNPIHYNVDLVFTVMANISLCGDTTVLTICLGLGMHSCLKGARNTSGQTIIDIKQIPWFHKCQVPHRAMKIRK